MEYQILHPSSKTANTALSVCFTKTELLSAGVGIDSVDFDPAYRNKTEFRKLYDLWKDPLYLADFFEENEQFFSDPYWRGITEESLVRDVVGSSRLVFLQIDELLKSGRLLSMFESLDEGEDLKRKRGHKFRSKPNMDTSQIKWLLDSMELL